MTVDNTTANKKYKMNKVIDALFLEFVHSKLDLHKKLTDPRVNKLLKQFWFEEYNKQTQNRRVY